MLRLSALVSAGLVCQGNGMRDNVRPAGLHQSSDEVAGSSMMGQFSSKISGLSSSLMKVLTQSVPLDADRVSVLSGSITNPKDGEAFTQGSGLSLQIIPTNLSAGPPRAELIFSNTGHAETDMLQMMFDQLAQVYEIPVQIKVSNGAKFEAAEHVPGSLQLALKTGRSLVSAIRDHADEFVVLACEGLKGSMSENLAKSFFDQWRHFDNSLLPLMEKAVRFNANLDVEYRNAGEILQLFELNPTDRWFLNLKLLLDEYVLPAKIAGEVRAVSSLMGELSQVRVTGLLQGYEVIASFQDVLLPAVLESFPVIGDGMESSKAQTLEAAQHAVQALHTGIKSGLEAMASATVVGIGKEVEPAIRDGFHQGLKENAALRQAFGKVSDQEALKNLVKSIEDRAVKKAMAGLQ